VEFAWPSNLCAGIQPGQFVIFAGATSMGKTALGLQQALHTASQGQRTLLVSIEISTRENLLRWLSAAARIRHQDLQNGDLTEAQRTVAREVAARLLRCRSKSRRRRARLKVLGRKSQENGTVDPRTGLVVIDYLQLIATKLR
jgi:replicative DNA helicase